MTRHLLLALPALLAGCMGTENRGLESVHQPVVSHTDYALDLRTEAGALPYGEERRLAQWLSGLRPRYGDRVAIDDPSGASAAARGQIAGLAAESGIILADAVPATPYPVAAATIRVVLTRARAEVPGCPDWSRDSSHEFDSNTSSNFGCAANGNLAAMVANPNDLVSGARTNGINDPAVSNRAIVTFRKATPTGSGGLSGGGAVAGATKGGN